MAMKRHICARCGKRLAADEAVYSKFTQARYCRTMKACDRRAATRTNREAGLFQVAA